MDTLTETDSIKFKKIFELYYDNYVNNNQAILMDSLKFVGDNSQLQDGILKLLFESKRGILKSLFDIKRIFFVAQLLLNFNFKIYSYF